MTTATATEERIIIIIIIIVIVIVIRRHAHTRRDINLNNCPCKRTSFRFVSLGKTRGKIGHLYALYYYYTYMRCIILTILIRLCLVPK